MSMPQESSSITTSSLIRLPLEQDAMGSRTLPLHQVENAI
jgi:hypothetical protein